MSIYTSPLQFGYFFSLLMWILFLVRGYREDRLSDKFLGWIMFILAMELQDYTFGFAGINILWNELNGFPRGVSFLFGPITYFYFRSQVNRSFQLRKEHFWHFLPYCAYFFYEISAFVQGPEAVMERQESDYNMYAGYVIRISLWLSFIYYLSKCLKIYRAYRNWSNNQFSNIELINFSWFRNFLYAMIFWLGFREIMNVTDFLLDLDFYQDWWWNLALVAVSLYIGLAGYSQKQPAKIYFKLTGEKGEDPKNQVKSSVDLYERKDEKSEIAERLSNLMITDRLYLQPELNLQELALHLKINPVQLSGIINQVFDQNFNDYINRLRVEEFIKLYKADVNQRYTLLSIALDSGFNSKATFNRAFKKIKGTSPKDFLDKFN